MCQRLKAPADGCSQRGLWRCGGDGSSRAALRSPIFGTRRRRRYGAFNLFAAFDTRTGKVYARCFRRKRQIEIISFLEYLDGTIPSDITKIHIVCDNLSVHKGKQVVQWLSKHSRFIFYFTPVHCSWMNQVDQWFSILAPARPADPD